LVIILVGAFLRFYKLGNNTFVADEFLDINSSYAYAKTGIWQNWDFNFGKVNEDNIFEARDERAWIYKWQVAQVLKIFPPVEEVARSVSVIWGIISIVLIFFVGRYFSRKSEIGLLSAFLFAVSVSGLIFDRRLRMYAMFFAVFLAFSWMLFRFLEEKYEGKNKTIRLIWEKFGLNVVYFLPAIILGIVSILTHQLTANIVFIVLIYCFIQLILNFKNKTSFINKYLSIILLSIFGYIGGIIFIPEKIGPYTAGLRFFENNTGYFSKIFTDYSHTILAVIFLIGGVYYLWKKQKLSKETLWLIVSFFGTFILAAFIWNRNSGDQYIFFVRPFGIILMASGIYFISKFFENNLEKFGKKVFLVSIILSLLILPNYAYFFQENNTYKQTSSSETPNYRKVFTYFKKSKNDEDVLITRKSRNYYWSGAEVKIFDFGGELAKEKLSLERLQNIISENPSGWFIFSDNDESYIANDAVTFAEKNMEKVSNVAVRGKIKVYRWNK
jgi:hypothetical protein